MFETLGQEYLYMTLSSDIGLVVLFTRWKIQNSLSTCVLFIYALIKKAWTYACVDFKFTLLLLECNGGFIT